MDLAANKTAAAGSDSLCVKVVAGSLIMRPEGTLNFGQKKGQAVN
jgi:hypothetical protein